jgi:hypothetical protein
MTTNTLLLSFFILANLPWLTPRFCLVIPIGKGKSILLRLIELLIYYFVSLLVSIAFEMDFSGDVYPQTWEFFVTTFSLFLVLSVPGVVYRFQWLPAQEKIFNR